MQLVSLKLDNTRIEAKVAPPPTPANTK